ncbi:MAG: phosphatase PAP2 family protein [Terracidiphilus sp.]|nr:phosphatase PAP2 family protein [Terracidiphilus sp.]
MIDFLRRRLDEIVTVLFLLVVLVCTLWHTPVFATPGGLLLAQVVLGGSALLMAVLVPAARFSSRARASLGLVLDFAPVVVAVAGYVALRLLNAYAITAALHIPFFDRAAMAADVALFGKTPYLIFAAWGWNSPNFLRVMTACYALYPLTPILVLGWFALRGDRASFLLVRRTLIVSFYLGYTVYILVPVSGPQTLLASASQGFIESTSGYAFLAGNFRYIGDCFPSLHTANPWLMTWVCRKAFPRWLLAVACIVCCGITLSTMALGLHYGIDVLAGLAWVFLIAPLARLTLPVRG